MHGPPSPGRNCASSRLDLISATLTLYEQLLGVRQRHTGIAEELASRCISFVEDKPTVLGDDGALYWTVFHHLSKTGSAQTPLPGPEKDRLFEG